MQALVGLLSEIESILDNPPPMPEIEGLSQNTWVALAIYAHVAERITNPNSQPHVHKHAA